RETFLASKLRWGERELPEQAHTLELYRAALTLRRSDPVWSHCTRDALRAEVVGSALVVQRGRAGARRVLVMNLGDGTVSLPMLADHLQLAEYEVQLRSSAHPGDVVPPATAVVLAC